MCVLAAGLSLATAALVSEAHATNSPKLLPSGGLRKTLHSGKLHIKAVVYGSSGEIKDDAFKLKPHDGMHYTTVKVGLKNIGPTVYARDLTAALAVTNDHGAVSHAVALGKHGLGKVVLKKDGTAYGRVFFEAARQHQDPRGSIPCIRGRPDRERLRRPRLRRKRDRRLDQATSRGRDSQARAQG